MRATVVGHVMVVAVRVSVSMIVVVTVCVIVADCVVVGGRTVRVSEPAVVVMPVLGASAAEATPEQREAERRDREPRGQRDPRIESLGHDVLRGVERHAPEQINAGGVRRGDDEAEDQRVPRVPREPTR